MCEQTTYFFPLRYSFILNPRNSEYRCSMLITFDFSGLMSNHKRSFSHIFVASNVFTASL